ncbi:MAG: GTP-binding protein, partial [Planctomycetes bacterium]|nr:GTP-binding protein [Planctomycetota bacterium]
MTRIDTKAERNSGVSREQMNIVIAGHVDHGKSTIIGRLLADTDSLPEGKLDRVRETCKRNSKPFEYAFLLDALKDEQSQGITIDAARVFFNTATRDYIIIDAPGHIDFLKNMVTGASRAEAAVLVIDAEEGVKENSRRHGYMISMLGITQLVVLVNKMDLVKYRQKAFDSVVAEYTQFLSDVDLKADFIPVSGISGDNIAQPTDNMAWYEGPTVLEAIDTFSKEASPVDKPFRMPVQDVYKFTLAGDKRRIIAGTVDTGSIEVGEEVVFYPSGKKSKVESIEVLEGCKTNPISAGWAASFTLDKQIYISRGQIATKAGQQPPEVTSTLRVNLFWMGKRPMVKDKDYLIKIGTAKETVRLKEVLRVIDASELNSAQSKDCIEHHDVGECVLHVRKAIAFDLA